MQNTRCSLVTGFQTCALPIYFHRVPVGYGYHREIGRAWCFAYFGIFYRDGIGIGGVRVVDHQEITDGTCIDGPVGNPFSIGRPAESIAAAEFFLVSPVERAVDDAVGAIQRERLGRSRAEFLHIAVMAA